MSWSQATWVVDAEQVEKVSAMLEGFLAQAITTENAGEDEFYEVAFPGKPDWEKVRVTALFNDTVELEPIINFITKQLTDNGAMEVPVSVTQLADQNWERVWLNALKPINVGTNLWVTPSWCQPVDPEARNIRLDPGLAFGTGTHATTHMCLRWLAEQNLTGQKVLDYGSGSGILAIAALLSKAGHADAVDIDPLAINACEENAERNGFSNQLCAFLPNQLSSSTEASYDLVIANILADVIIELKEILLLHLKPTGKLLLTGLLATQAERVATAYGENIHFDSFFEDQWCLLVGTRH